MMGSIRRQAWLAAIFTLLCPAGLLAQAVANAEIRGVITDASGAVVPAAQVRATQTETGYARSTLSGVDGSYALPNLPVGPYKVEVTVASFANYVQSGITLQVGNNVQ